jgi:uncharacterized membrane protein
MDETTKDKSSWAIGGGVILGLGVGFFFLRTDALWFVGCMMIGLGLGLLISALISSKK